MKTVNIKELRSWIGRTETAHDVASLATARRLSATLNQGADALQTGTPLPALWHWLYFLPEHLTSELDSDGHVKRGGFLPAVPLPRRMWAGSRIEYQSEIGIGNTIERKSTIADVRQKNRGKQALAFVTVRHEITADDRPALIEEQDIVYLGPADPDTRPVKTTAAPASPQWSETITPDPFLLFRYSALTFNAHRIHYDRVYALEAEDYPGLVVHAPLTATLLLDRFQARFPSRSISTISFRAQRPLFDAQSVELQGRRDKDDALVWALNSRMDVAMTANVTLRPE